MSLWGMLKKSVRNPNKIAMNILYRVPMISNRLSDEKYLKIIYRCTVGRKLCLENPHTFNEKLQWLKLYDRRPEYIKMVDKYQVKKYVADIIGDEYIIPTIGVWDSFDDIDFGSLPDKFVLKCTHDSGGLVICKDKRVLDKKKARRKINKSLKRNYYWIGREWPYKGVTPKIIAETYMGDDNQESLTDYKVMCFNGKARCIFTCTERNSSTGLKVTFFDTEWNRMSFERQYPSSTKTIKKPKSLSKMISLAEKLSENMLFARIDFYEVHDQLYFGEITLYPGNGVEVFRPEKWDQTLGSWIVLPIDKTSNDKNDSN